MYIIFRKYYTKHSGDSISSELVVVISNNIFLISETNYVIYNMSIIKKCINKKDFRSYDVSLLYLNLTYTYIIYYM